MAKRTRKAPEVKGDMMLAMVDIGVQIADLQAQSPLDREMERLAEMVAARAREKAARPDPYRRVAEVIARKLREQEESYARAVPDPKVIFFPMSRRVRSVAEVKRLEVGLSDEDIRLAFAGLA